MTYAGFDTLSLSHLHKVSPSSLSIQISVIDCNRFIDWQRIKWEMGAYLFLFAVLMCTGLVFLHEICFQSVGSISICVFVCVCV